MARRWVVFRSEPREDGKPAKVPLTPSGKAASVTDEGTWGQFAKAWRAYGRGGYDGVGLVFHARDRLCGVDIDNCRDAATGEILAWAQDIITALDSYAEVSPSGTGVKVFLYADRLPLARKRVKAEGGGVECYFEKRFFAVTGHRLPGLPPAPQERAEQLRGVLDRLGMLRDDRPTPPPLFPPPPPPAGSDIDIVERIRGNPRHSHIWDGATGKFDTPSEADFSIIREIRYQTGGDRERTIAIFLNSPRGQRPRVHQRRNHAGGYPGYTYDRINPSSPTALTTPARANFSAPPTNNVTELLDNFARGQAPLLSSSAPLAGQIFASFDAAPRCSSATGHFASSNGKRGVFSLSCRRKSCPACLPRLNALAVANAHSRLSALPAVYLIRGATARTMKNMADRAARAKSSRPLYFLAGGEQSFAVSDTPLPGSEQIPLPAALDMLAAHLIASGRVTSSQPWSVARFVAGGVAKGVEWKRLGVGKGHVEGVARALKEEGVPIKRTANGLMYDLPRDAQQAEDCMHAIQKAMGGAS